MSKREITGEVLRIALFPAPSGIGRFEARLDGTDRVLCVSRTPFFDAARKLIAEGNNPDATLVMRHAGSKTDSLQAQLGAAASLSVEETDYGPKLRRWKPIPTLAVRPRIAFDDLPAITSALRSGSPAGARPRGLSRNLETTP